MATRRNKSRLPSAKSEQQPLTPIQRALLKEADRMVAIATDGIKEEARVGDVLARKALQMALAGSPHAMSNALYELLTAERLKRAEIEKEEEIGRWFKQRQQERLDEAIKEDADIDTILPHPEDIIVTVGQGYRVVGPWDEAELEPIKKSCALRDLFLLQHVLEERLRSSNRTTSRGKGNSGDSRGYADSSALLLAYFMDHGLPQRFQLSDEDVLAAIMLHNRKTKRELLKQACSVWRSIGHPKPRGWTLPPFHEMRAMLERAVPATRSLYDDIASGKVVGEYAIAERAAEIWSITS